MGFLTNLLGKKVDYDDLITRGAIIVDVRSASEYKSGHIPSSLNIPLQELSGKMSKLDKSKPIITCCASGMRSGMAKTQMMAAGFKEVHNGGGWSSLFRKLQ